MPKLSSRILKGGTVRVVYSRPDTGATVDVRGALVAEGGPPYRETTEYAETAAGTRRPKARKRELAVGVADRGLARELELWAEAGVAVRAVVLGHAGGEHTRWDEPVVPEVEPRPSGFGGLAARAVTLFSAAFAADVAHSDDLAEGLAVQAGGLGSYVELDLPAPGAVVYASGADASGPYAVRCYSFGGSALLAEEHATLALLQLPPSTYRVRVEWASGEPPGLFLAPPRLALGGFRLVAQSASSSTISSFGAASIDEDGGGGVTFRDASALDATARLTGPASKLRPGAEDDPDSPTTIQTD